VQRPHLKYERQLHKRGYSLIAGVDEAGRGPLAGPVVAAAVILPKHIQLPEVADSKQLSAGQRETAFQQIMETALAIGISAASASVIDRTDILTATLKAMRIAISRLSPSPDYILIDGNRLPAGLPVIGEAIVDGDCRVLSIAAASIVAKVTRDRLMLRLDRLYPDYKFAEHKGYGTPDHFRILSVLGPTKHHRFSFSPIRQARLGL
jgi:ribonuclease HII